MSITKKISVAGSFATILGVAIATYSAFVASSEQEINQVMNGDKNTVVGENSGHISINYNENSSNSKNLVLRNSTTGVSLVLSEPDITVVTDKTKHVCAVISGTPVSLTGKVSDINASPRWKEISILKGECAGKTGWVSASVLSFE